MKVEVKKWKDHVDRCNVGMVPCIENRKNINELREKQVEEIIFQRFHWEEVQRELKELNKFKSMQKEKDQLYAFSMELMSFRDPSPSYSVFLYEQLNLFRLKALKEGRPYQLTPSAQFLETFMERSFTEQNLLCEFYLHEMDFPMDLHSNLAPYLGDVQFRDFPYFVHNHVQWERAFQTTSQNEANSNLWIRIEP